MLIFSSQGGIVARLVIDDSSICFINCHLAAGQNHIRARNADVAAVLEDKQVFPPSSSYLDPISYAGGGDGTMVLDHEIVFVRFLPCLINRAIKLTLLPSSMVI